MKFLSITITLPLLLLISDTLQFDVYENCRNQFNPTSGLCKKFNFITSKEALKKGCIVSTNGTTFYDQSDLPEVKSLDSRLIKMASMITNVFEDGDTNFAYAYCEDIKDSRGFTSGYAGFTTGTGDAETLIQAYTKDHPNNKLEHFLPRLHEISQLSYCDRTNRGSTKGIEGYCAAWKSEACNKNGEFAKIQRQWVYENYMLPSARYAAQNGIQSALGKAIFYDTIIQHGFQYVEPDINIVRILVLTGARKKNESEQDYLTRFLTTRRELQCCYPDNVWPASASRSADLQTLVNQFDKNKDLTGSIELVKFGKRIHGNEDINTDSKHCK
ncbi:lysozyme-like domain-containing protein [Cokeromyces recurvatus]|uniref:lysozyme-like domain-containing protein n=1 Tax=Cokeromyces recurvatus TaxID=90255 RepID=UPI0022210244|nr:lysozyme-like domain-containing protein [Cokeromyces recurvatus]KAI7899948.1 lysozyme-like domain-containing protein [Cokeromyces recurvatus]